MARPLRIAAAQYAPVLGDLDANRQAAVEWAGRAVDEGAGLIVLPELASSGYAFQSEEDAEAAAENGATSAYVDALAEVAARGDAQIVSGFDEAGDACRYNSALVIGPSGVIATYRKLHLFHNEKSWFQAGGDLVVVDLPWGRLGVMICYDIWFPEVARTMARAGCDVIAVPTNWVSNFKNTVYDDRGFCQGDYVAMATAAQNGVVMACADRTGEENGVCFLGASIIVGADGWPVAGPASAQDDALLIADVDLDSVAAARQRTPRNHLLGDRRPDAYNFEIVSVSGADVPSPSQPSS